MRAQVFTVCGASRLRLLLLLVIVAVCALWSKFDGTFSAGILDASQGTQLAVVAGVDAARRAIMVQPALPAKQDAAGDASEHTRPAQPTQSAPPAPLPQPMESGAGSTAADKQAEPLHSRQHRKFERVTPCPPLRITNVQADPKILAGLCPNTPNVLDRGEVLPEALWKFAGHSSLVTAVMRGLCCVRMPESLMRAQKEVREKVIQLFRPLIEAEPGPPILDSVKPPPLGPPRCNASEWSPSVFSGRLRNTPARIIDVVTGMGGGPELEFLEMHLYELADVVELFVIPESSYNMRGDKKPRHFKNQQHRFRRFQDKILYIDLDECKSYLDAVARFRSIPDEKRPRVEFNVQDNQRGCIWKLLQKYRPDLPDETLLIFGDLDVIPYRGAMHAVARCELAKHQSVEDWVVQLNTMTVSFTLHRASGCAREKRKADWLQTAVVSMARARKTGVVFLAYGGLTPVIQRGGVHLTSTGCWGHIFYKGLQHGEGGGGRELYRNYGERLNTCAVATIPGAASAVIRFSYFDAKYFWRNWDQKCQTGNLTLPSREDMEHCRVPWILQRARDRYPCWWGDIEDL
eukprot:TRINITY_DN62000_c0_g1_i1.p1 TRINITY_DN62000_c0_g1~~TRINITY_DN62000_c0_g1_i1.p1  ORF type:complete len:575 (+),score=48.07 TRINITY_DN62000_c0_g1_i1:123-1847(+)